ncbi:MAG: TonB-dependent receptor [Pseudomonadota bacterium]
MKFAPIAAAVAASTLVPQIGAAETGEPVRRMEEVVVTATKRDESIQDVPVAVTALSEMQLERAGVQDVTDLPSLSSSFHLNSSQTEARGTTLRMRGVGTTGNNVGMESAVGVFMDGVHLSRPGIALGDMMDIDMIEVLRGPQGTLFGRNTSAGALVVRTKQPNLQETEAWVDATTGNHDMWSVQAGGNLPLIDNKLAARAAVSVRERDGFVDSTTGAESATRDRVSTRGQLLWVVDDRTDVRVIADYAEAEEQCCDLIHLIESPLAAPGGAFEQVGLGNGGVESSGEDALEDRRSNGERFSEPFDQWGVSTEINHARDNFEVVYLGAWREFETTSQQHTDFVSLDVFSTSPEVANGQRTGDDIRTFTQELRISGDTPFMQWMVGGYYMDEKIESTQGMGLGQDFDDYAHATVWLGAIQPAFAGLPAATQQAVRNVPMATGGTFGDVLDAPNPHVAFAGGVSSAGAYAQNHFEQQTESWSLFTHNTFYLTDRLDLVAGLRWVEEEKDGSFVQPEANNGACLNAAANAEVLDAAGLGALGGGARTYACFPFVAPVDESNAALPAEYDLSFDDSELIGTLKGVYAINDLTSAYLSFTHGFKAGGFNLDPTAATSGESPQFDAEIVDAWEAGVKTELFDQRMRLNTAVFHQEFEDFQVLEFTGSQYTTFNVPKAESTGAEVEVLATPHSYLDVNLSVTYQDAHYPSDCDGNDANAPPQVTQLCGGRLTNSSDWVAVTGASWEQPIAGSLNWFVNGNVRWESKRRTGTQWRDADGDRIPKDFQGDNAKVNLRTGIARMDGRWSVELWGHNIFDERTRNMTASTPLRLGGRVANIEAPRTYGLTVRTEM